MKTRKYAVGGSADEEFFGAEELAEAKARPKFQETSKYKVRDVSKDAKAKPASTEKSQDEIDNMSFKQAFAYKKNKGKAFTWRGKKYKTEMASDKKKPAASKRMAQTDPGDIGDRTPSKAMMEAEKKAPAKKKETGRRDMTNFASMSFEEQMEYLRTKGKENTGSKTKMMKGGMPQKFNQGGMANCGASMKPNGGSRNK